METYKIIRFFFNDDVENIVIERGLTLKEAQSHCRDEETNSKTCSDYTLENEKGPWFDGYEKE